MEVYDTSCINYYNDNDCLSLSNTINVEDIGEFFSNLVYNKGKPLYNIYVEEPPTMKHLKIINNNYTVQLNNGKKNGKETWSTKNETHIINWVNDSKQLFILNIYDGNNKKLSSTIERYYNNLLHGIISSNNINKFYLVGKLINEYEYDKYCLDYKKKLIKYIDTSNISIKDILNIIIEYYFNNKNGY